MATSSGQIFLVLFATSLAACGGRTEHDDGAPADAAMADCAMPGRPPNGLDFFEWSTSTSNDTCGVAVSPTRDVMVAIADGGFNAPMNAQGARQDFDWQGSHVAQFQGCSSYLRYEVTGTTTRSIDLDLDSVWIDPASCNTGPVFAKPTSDCTTDQHLTFVLPGCNP